MLRQPEELPQIGFDLFHRIGQEGGVVGGEETIVKIVALQLTGTGLKEGFGHEHVGHYALWRNDEMGFPLHIKPIQICLEIQGLTVAAKLPILSRPNNRKC